MSDPAVTDLPDAPSRGSQVGVGVGSLPPGRIADLLAEAQAMGPDRPDRMLALAREARALAEAEDHALGTALARGVEGFALYLASDHEAAFDLLTRALAELEPLGDMAGRTLALGALASVHISLGHYDEALEMALESLSAARSLGDRAYEAWILVTMGNVYVELGEPDQAFIHAEPGLRLFAETGEVNGQARAHTVLGGALRDLGRYDEARAHLESALRLAREQDETLTEARALNDLGELDHVCGRYDSALAYHHQALALRREVGNRQAQATSLVHIGRALTAMGQAEDALDPLREALVLAEETGAEPRAAEAHRALADAYEAAGDPSRALDHFRRFHAVREALLSAQSRSRIQTLQVRVEAERVRQEAEVARMRTEELGAINAELTQTLEDLRSAQRRLVQAEKQASLGRLSAGLAHEIQNPLNFVANFANLNAEVATDLLDTLEQARQSGEPPDPDAIRADLESIVDNARRVRDHSRRAEGIVRSLMGHVRDVGGERRPADLHELLERAVSTGIPHDSPIHVVREYVADLAPVDLVPGSIQRVFVNLIENARWSLEHCAEAEGDGFVPTLTITTEAGDGEVRVKVADNGLGIPLANCTRVFEPFFTTKPAGQGTGLGLSLAYDIVTEGHGGTLGVISREGDGATFTVTLPTG